MNYSAEYRNKLRTPEEAAALVKSGDWLEFGMGVNFPVLCDRAIARRKNELTDVKIRAQLVYGPIECVECDPEGLHFTYNSWHTSAYERRLCEKGMCYYSPMLFRNLFWYYKNFLTVNEVYICAAPMDGEGYFNFSVATGIAKSAIQVAGKVILEVNENMPRVNGEGAERIHISEVDCIVEGPHGPMPCVPSREPSQEDKRIALNILPYISDGSTIQLGIGGVPDALGKVLAESELKDLGMHTELCTDAFYILSKAGKLTNAAKTIHRGKGVFALATGSQELYDWIDGNPDLLSFSIDYVNQPEVIAQMDNFISLNSCVAVDLYGQTSSESSGLRHISGTGGQVDFLTGASMSRGGKAFICMNSVFRDENGKQHSRIVPHFSGDIITSPRSQAFYFATEYGVVNLAGKSSWERAEELISIAHPDFRDELIRAAGEQHIWRQSNKR